MQKNISELVQMVIDRLKMAKYAEGTIKRYKSVLDQVVQCLKDKGDSEYTPELGLEYLERKKKTLKPKSYECYSAVIKQMNDACIDREFQAIHKKEVEMNPPTIYAQNYQNYIDFRKSKGLADETIDNDRRYTICFLSDLVGKGCISLNDITPQLIFEVIASKNTGYRTTTRHFLSFLYDEGYIPYDYSIFVSSPYKQHRLPPFYTKEEQRRIHDEMVKNGKVPKRNHAIFLLATRYGFRDGNITRLKFEDVSFDKDRITIDQVKTGVRKSYPLYPEVKNALLDYIRNERPESDIDYIFVTLTPPHRRMRAVYAVFHNAIEASGIVADGRTMGSHSAGRASLATEIINNGMSYELVREALGHTSEDVITKYATLDIEKLRVCAQPVEPSGGFFARFLEGKEKV